MTSATFTATAMRVSAVQVVARIAVVCALAVAASCGGGSNGRAPSAAPTQFLYATAATGASGGIYGFGVDPATGALTPVAGSPFVPASSGGLVAVTRDSRFLYSSDSTGSLVALSIQADGSLIPVSGSPFTIPEGLRFLVAHPTADFLYGFGYLSKLMVFAIDPATGVPSLTSSTSTASSCCDAGTAGFTFTSDGRYLYQGDSADSRVAGYSTNAASGALSAVPGSPLILQPEASSDPGAVAVDPAGKFLYVGNAFPGRAGGGIWAFSINAVSGALTAVPGSPFGAVGIALAVDASGQYLLFGAGDSCRSVPINPATGALTALPGSTFGAACLSIAADPTGPYVFTGGSASVVAYAMDQATGVLTPISEIAIPGDILSLALTH